MQQPGLVVNVGALRKWLTPAALGVPVYLGLATQLVTAQTAPQRSDELCATLKQSASDNSRQFIATKPGACMMNIDTGYNFFVDYDPQTLYLSLSVNPALLNGDAGAFWLRLSALDNLSHTALGTTQRTVFDKLNRMAKDLSLQELKAVCGSPRPCDANTAKGSLQDLALHGKAERAVLTGRSDAKTSIMMFMAAARVNDIERMASDAKLPASERIPTWRKTLALSLQAFAAGAKGYADAYQKYTATAPKSQPRYRTTFSCYTNLVGSTIFTNCN